MNELYSLNYFFLKDDFNKINNIINNLKNEEIKIFIEQTTRLKTKEKNKIINLYEFLFKKFYNDNLKKNIIIYLIQFNFHYKIILYFIKKYNIFLNDLIPIILKYGKPNLIKSFFKTFSIKINSSNNIEYYIDFLLENNSLNSLKEFIKLYNIKNININLLLNLEKYRKKNYLYLLKNLEYQISKKFLINNIDILINYDLEILIQIIKNIDYDINVNIFNKFLMKLNLKYSYLKKEEKLNNIYFVFRYLIRKSNNHVFKYNDVYLVYFLRKLLKKNKKIKKEYLFIFLGNICFKKGCQKEFINNILLEFYSKNDLQNFFQQKLNKEIHKKNYNKIYKFSNFLKYLNYMKV